MKLTDQVDSNKAKQIIMGFVGGVVLIGGSVVMWNVSDLHLNGVSTAGTYLSTKQGFRQVEYYYQFRDIRGQTYIAVSNSPETQAKILYKKEDPNQNIVDSPMWWRTGAILLFVGLLLLMIPLFGLKIRNY